MWFDTTELLIRPDRSKDSQALFDKQVISAAVVRRENGFGDDDAPTDDERKESLLRDLLQLRPDWAPKILPALGIDLDETEEAAQSAADDAAPGPVSSRR